MSTHLSTLLQLNAPKRTQTLLTHPRRECQLISLNTNSAHQAQVDSLTLNQEDWKVRVQRTVVTPVLAYLFELYVDEVIIDTSTIDIDDLIVLEHNSK
jgi:hypothetical protein